MLSRRRFVSLLIIGSLMVATFGCRKEEESPAPEAEEKASAPEAEGKAYETLLPAEGVPEGWQRSGKVKVYAGKKLYDSIDGAADRFFQYSFREQYAVSYSSNDAGRSIQVEAYDMGTPDDAFGIFSCHDNIMCQHTKIGLAATVSEMNLDFCQGKHFVRLLAMGFDEGEADKPLRAFAEAIAANIKPVAGFPELVRRLPDGHVKGTVLFFHTWETLNEKRYMAEENVFRLDKKTNGVLAAYTAEEKKTDDQIAKLEKDVLYLVEYPDKDAAQSAKMSYINFLNKRVNDSKAEGKPASERLQLIGVPQEPIEIYQLYKGEKGEQRLITNTRVFQNYIFGLWEITDEEKAKRLVKTLAGSLRP